VFSAVNIRADKRGWLVLAFGVVGIALMLDLLIRHGPVSVDFHTYAAASRVGLEQGWSHIYDQGAVGAEQKRLDPGQYTQPFLSPPTVAFLTAPLSSLPYDTAFVVWGGILFAAFTAALLWASSSRGWVRWIVVIATLSPWWVLYAINVGQVVPLVAAGMVVAWRLLRDRRDALAGIALAAILLKPNTAALVPLALLFAWRPRALATWLAVAAGVMVVILATVGMSGVSEYMTQLRGPLPRGADELTLHGALAATGMFAAALRLLIIGAVLAAAYKLRASPGLVLPIAIVGSLLVSPYLHSSDLCMLAAAGWMVWEERPQLSWRVPLAAGWVLASPYLYLTGAGLHLRQWPWLEIALLVVLVAGTWWPLTTRAESRRRAPA